MAGKGDHAFPPGPFLIADFGIADDGIGQVRLAIARDAPYLELSDRDLSMRAVQMGVEAGARLQLEHAFTFVQGPDSRKGGAHEGDERLGTLLQRAGERVGTGQRQADRRPQCRQLHALKDVPSGRASSTVAHFIVRSWDRLNAGPRPVRAQPVDLTATDAPAPFW
jgi:hypothetical protein